jgi:hypothetical protein
MFHHGDGADLNVPPSTSGAMFPQSIAIVLTPVSWPSVESSAHISFVSPPRIFVLVAQEVVVPAELFQAQ